MGNTCPGRGGHARFERPTARPRVLACWRRRGAAPGSLGASPALALTSRSPTLAAAELQGARSPWPHMELRSPLPFPHPPASSRRASASTVFALPPSLPRMRSSRLIPPGSCRRRHGHHGAGTLAWLGHHGTPGAEPKP